MFQAGQQIGVYTLIRQIGQGGFGEVWLAENRSHSPSEKVAIKLPRNDQIDLQAVKEEVFNWTGAGKHKNILPFIEWIPFGNRIALVSEYASDGSLQNLINKKGSLPIPEAVEIAIGILNGLTHLHNRQIIHRDLKPDNVLFQGGTPRLTDFGISRAMPQDSLSQLIAGTANYMSVESFAGTRNEKTDIFSVGVILYQTLTNKLPFLYRKEIMKAVITENENLLRQYKDEIPQSLPNKIPSDLQDIIIKSIAKEPGKRYQTADEMYQELKTFEADFVRQINVNNEIANDIAEIRKEPSLDPKSARKAEISNVSSQPPKYDSEVIIKTVIAAPIILSGWMFILWYLPPIRELLPNILWIIVFILDVSQVKKWAMKTDFGELIFKTIFGNFSHLFLIAILFGINYSIRPEITVKIYNECKVILGFKGITDNTKPGRF